tara:strand:+ start:354 stop:569 length:216 start_codon:yes stop_codon:yes gene_type:complete
MQKLSKLFSLNYDILINMKNDDHFVLDDKLEKIDNFCEECKKEDESVKQNLIIHGYKICKSCNLAKTIFPI